MEMDNLKDSWEIINDILNHRERLSEEEVGKWLSVAGNRQLLDEAARVKRVLRREEFGEMRREEWERLRGEVSERRLWLRRWLSVAALVVCVVGAGLWGWLRQQGGEAALVAEVPVPGSMRAELMLAEGTTVALGERTKSINTQGLSGIVDDTLQGLDYSQAKALEEGEKVQTHVLRVPVGGFYRMVLPDGSSVCLNAASELHFPARFTGGKREVYLKGEGYFEVTKDTVRPFVVRVRDAEVRVLGTKFNIHAYEEEERVYTTLAQGAVAFYSEQQGAEVCLKPGMQGIMEKRDGTVTVAEVDAEVYTAWTEGRFVFRSMDLEMILRQLQRWYDFEVFYRSEEVKRYEFRGVVSRDMELRKVLDIIEETTDLRFEVKGRTVVVGK